MRRRRSKGVEFLPDHDYWEVDCRARYREVLAKLAAILPDDLTLYVEGVAMAPLVRSYLEARPAADPTEIRSGTIWPRSQGHHMPMTADNVAGLVELMTRLAEPEVADHLHAYRGDVAWLIWYDAFSAPFYLRNEVGEEAVRELCGELGCEWRPFG